MGWDGKGERTRREDARLDVPSGFGAEDLKLLGPPANDDDDIEFELEREFGRQGSALFPAGGSSRSVSRLPSARDDNMSPIACASRTCPCQHLDIII